MVGFVPLGTTTFGFPIQCTDNNRHPQTPDAAPTWRIYAAGTAAALLTGTAPSSDQDSQTGWRPTSNVSITAGNNFASGNVYFIRVSYAISAVTYTDTSTFAVT